MPLRRPALRLRRPALAAAVACLAFVPVSAAGAAAPAKAHPAHHAAAPAFQPDRTPLPASVIPRSGGTGSTSAPTTGTGGGTSTGAIARLVGGLALVLAVIYGVYWLLKTVGKSRKSESDGRIQLLSTTTIGPNKTLHLVRIGDDVVLVGASEHSVTPLRAYSAEELRRDGFDVDEGQGPFRPTGEGPTLGRLVAELKRRTAR